MRLNLVTKVGRTIVRKLYKISHFGGKFPEIILITEKILIRIFVVQIFLMKPIKKSRLSQPSEFIKMMVIILVFVSVFLFSKSVGDEQMVIIFFVLGLLLFILQVVFVIMYKKGSKTLAFWFMILLGLLMIAALATIGYFIKYGIVLSN